MDHKAFLFITLTMRRQTIKCLRILYKNHFSKTISFGYQSTAKTLTLKKISTAMLKKANHFHFSCSLSTYRLTQILMLLPLSMSPLSTSICIPKLMNSIHIFQWPVMGSWCKNFEPFQGNTDEQVVKVSPNKDRSKSPQRRTRKKVNRLSKTRYCI